MKKIIIALSCCLLGPSAFPLAAAEDGKPAAKGAKESAPRPETIKGAKGGEIKLTIIEHATFVLEGGGKTVYVDPVGGAKRFEGIAKPDIILITDIHFDHLDPKTLKGLAGKGTTLVLPQAAVDALAKADPSLSALPRNVLANGASAKVAGIPIEAVPMYNTTEERKQYHPKGRGNGYVLDLAGVRVYISGDTEEIPEMKKLKDIDVAFLCMNLPYTMDVEQAASAALAIHPRIVYPYHSKGQDTSKFKSLVEAKAKDIEVRLRDWYPKSR